MKLSSFSVTDRTLFMVSVFCVLAVGTVGVLSYQNYKLRLAIAEQGNSLVATQSEFWDTKTALENKIALLEGTLAETEENLSETIEERNELDEDLRDEKERTEDFEDQVEDLTGTVEKLDKLANTDPELLQKYSKVFFLNEHFEPPRLEEIEKDYVYDESREHLLDTRVIPFFEDMVEDALDDDINLWVVSAYRSFEYQSQLKGQYTVTYGSGANAFSADQGYSEHQLGTTVDFTTNGLGGGLNGFQNTPAYEWLQDNAHKYGFTLSYPPNNQFYVFEPWHWRFVGRDLADDLHDDNDHFYDLDQRKIDEYLISIFD